MPTHNGPGDPYINTPPPVTPPVQDSALKDQASPNESAGQANIGKDYSNANA